MVCLGLFFKKQNLIYRHLLSSVSLSGSIQVFCFCFLTKSLYGFIIKEKWPLNVSMPQFPGTGDYVMLHGKREGASLIKGKDLRWEDYPRLFNLLRT